MSALETLPTFVTNFHCCVVALPYAAVKALKPLANQKCLPCQMGCPLAGRLLELGEQLPVLGPAAAGCSVEVNA